MRCRNFVPLLDGFALQDHLAVFELADEIEIATFVVDPGLFPFACVCVEGGDAGSAQDGAS
jgi:hypothetical protein